MVYENDLIFIFSHEQVSLFTCSPTDPIIPREQLTLVRPINRTEGTHSLIEWTLKEQWRCRVVDVNYVFDTAVRRIVSKNINPFDARGCKYCLGFCIENNRPGKNGVNLFPIPL